MKNSIGILAIAGLLSLSQLAAADSITDNYATGDTLTATKMNNIKSAVNDNDARIKHNDNRIRNNEAQIIHNDVRLHNNETRINGIQARLAELEAAPKANVAATAPTQLDDINAGFPVGSVWVDLTTKDAYILVDSAPGASVWKLITEPRLYEIGDTGPAGGIVFYVTDGGLHGLEAAPAVQGLVRWGCPGIEIAGADGTAVGTGAQNTADILADCAEPGIAARVVDTYTLNGFDDWFLPSIDALGRLYANRAVFDDIFGFGYWSSSEFDSDQVWILGLGTGSQNGANKNGLSQVRPVRIF